MLSHSPWQHVRVVRVKIILLLVAGVGCLVQKTFLGVRGRGPFVGIY